MIWLVLSLVVAFAIAQSLVIERLWRDRRRSRGEFAALHEQLDALAATAERQALTPEQFQDQIEPVVAAIRESNQVVVESTESLIGTIREARTERRRLRGLIENAGALQAQSGTAREQADPKSGAPESSLAATSPSPPEPISWPDTRDNRKRRRSRPAIVRAERVGRAKPAKRRAMG